MEIAVRDELFIKVERVPSVGNVSLSLSFAVCVTLSACVPGKERKGWVRCSIRTYLRRDDVLINSTG